MSYGRIGVDFALDCLMIYKDYSLIGLQNNNSQVLISGTTFVFENIRKYISSQDAYLDVQDYIEYLFETYSD
jgi:hypothetical protein